MRRRRAVRLSERLGRTLASLELHSSSLTKEKAKQKSPNPKLGCKEGAVKAFKHYVLVE